MKRYVIRRNSDGRYWCGNLQGGPWSISIDNARPLTRGDANFYRNSDQVVSAVNMTIKGIRKGA